MYPRTCSCMLRTRQYKSMSRLLAGADARAEGDDVRARAVALHLLEQVQRVLPQPSHTACLSIPPRVSALQSEVRRSKYDCCKSKTRQRVVHSLTTPGCRTSVYCIVTCLFILRGSERARGMRITKSIWMQLRMYMYGMPLFSHALMAAL